MTRPAKASTVIGIAALAYSIIIVWGGTWLIANSRDKSFPTEELIPLLLQTLIAFAPFGFLLLLAKYKQPGIGGGAARLGKAAITGLACSVLIWGYYVYEGLTYDGRGGVNLGLAFLVLISPVIVYAPMHLVMSRYAINTNVG